jgi:hypothetical protein
MSEERSSLSIKAASRRRWQAIFLIAASIGAGLFLHQHWNDIAQALEGASAGGIAAGFAASLGFILCSYTGWRALLPKLEAGRDKAVLLHAFLQGQLGKYLPGGIWPFLATAHIGADSGINQRTLMGSLSISLLVNCSAGVAIALAVLPSHLFSELLGGQAMTLALAALLIAAGFAALKHPAVNRWMAQKLQFEFSLSAGSLAIAFGAGAMTWLMGGVQIAALSSALGQDVTLVQIATYAGCYALAWIAGFLFMIAPAGVGVREGTLIALLSTSMPLAEATIIALISRVLFTLADILVAAASAATRTGVKAGPAASKAAQHPHRE